MKIRFVHPSSAHRWWHDACPGSVRAELMAPVVESDGDIALQGSAAHRLFEICLTKKQNTERYLDKEIMLLKPHVPYTVDEDMAEHVQDGIDLVRRYVGKGTLWVEKTVNLKVNDVEAGGTPDAVWYGTYAKDPLSPKGGKERQLHVMDLKYGYMAVTPPSENKQIKIYVSGKMRELAKQGKTVDSIHLWIYQPRLDTEFPFKHDVITPLDMVEFELELDESVEALKNPNAPRMAGSHCLYCKAHAVCKEAERAAFKIMRTKYSEGERQRVGDLLFQVPIATAWIKALKNLGTTMGMNDKPPTGWVMGAGRRTKRWNGDKEEHLKKVGTQLKRLGFSEDEYAPRKLVSPAKAMSIAKSKPKALDAVAKLWFWSPGKTRLQPEANVRHHLNAAQFFDDQRDDGQEE